MTDQKQKATKLQLQTPRETSCEEGHTAHTNAISPSDSVGWRRPSFARDVSKTICHTHDSANSCELCFLGNVVFLPEF